MYKTIIELKKEVPDTTLQNLTDTIKQAFHNQAGMVENTGDTPYHFVFKGDEESYCCMQMGNLALDKMTLFHEYVQTWTWEDEDPEESCDLLLEYAKPVY